MNCSDTGQQQAQVIFATSWKNEVSENLEKWKDEMAEYAMIAKLTTYVNKRSIIEFEDCWKPFFICYR